ncbi:MAG: hypothetical protein HKN04_11645 [Rhodothermaceae bacterium]|nr:hypothetical protein [Rhodothermaceae bacterium]
MAASSSVRTPRLVWVLLGLWALLALVLSAGGALTRIFPPLFAFGFTALALVALVFVPTLRRWAETVSLRPLVLYHTVRFVGVAFLVLEAQGRLPAEWAIPAGWGDIAAAIGALAVAVLALPITSRGHWGAVLGWNVFGLLDILAVLGGAIRIARTDLSLLEPLTQVPLGLLPTFIVPLILVSHGLIFWRLAKERF